MKFEDIDAYLRKISPGGDKVLRSMEIYARRNGFPIVGPLVGRWLYQMALISRARKILELGSGYGYSAYWFSKAISRQGHIILTDMDESNRKRAFEYFRKGRLKSKFEFLIGDALEIAGRLERKFDIIFNDIDKEDYPATIELAAKLLTTGGLFITDNIIWDGLVYNKQAKDKATSGIRKFTRQLYADRRFFTTVMPLRDGLTLALRK